MTPPLPFRRALRRRRPPLPAALMATLLCVACAAPPAVTVDEGVSPAATSAEVPAGASTTAPAPARAARGDAADDAWRALLERNIVRGDPDGRLRPAAPLPRAEFAALLARALALPDAPGGCFDDVPAQSWYAGPVCALAGRGVLRGDGRGRARPLEPVRRAEALALLRRAFDPESGAGAEPGAERGALDAWAARRGLPATTGDPAAPLTRDDGAALLAALLRAEPGASAATAAAPAVPPGCAPGAPGVGDVLELSVNGATRRVRVAPPAAGARGAGQRALVIGFHGRTSPAAEFAGYSDLDEVFPDAWLAFPEALPAAGGFRWSDPGDAPGALRDYALFDALAAELARRVCLDPARVYVAGHSLGSSFAASLACARGERIRAALLVAGGGAVRACSAPVAALVVHNPADRLVPVAEGERVRDAFAALAGTATAGGAGAPWTSGALAALDCVRWSAPGAAVPVGWCPHDRDYARSGRYYPHAWPDGAAAAFRAFTSDLGSP